MLRASHGVERDSSLAYASSELELPRTESERVLRVWPESVLEVCRWCRASKVEPLDASQVPGANDFERRQLAALGGVAASLADRSSSPISLQSLPTEIQTWLASAPEPPSDLIDKLYADLGKVDDPLALAYERIVAGPRRRRLGTFFTPKPVLSYVRRLVKRLARDVRTVADPGAGVGAYTAAALGWWEDADVHAVDINLVTLGLLATRPDLAPKGAISLQRRLRVGHGDFLDWLTSTWPELEEPRIILGNPPYIRHQQLTGADKVNLRRACGALAPGARAGLATYFLAASMTALSPGDSLCLLLPANWLEADYARSLRSYLWSAKKRRVELHIFPNELNIFPGAQVSAMILFIGPKRDGVQPFRLVDVHGNLEDGFHGKTVMESQRYSPVPTSFTPECLRQSIAETSNSEEIDEVPIERFAIVRRGVATGANSFFLRTRSEVDELPEGSFVPAISRLRDMPSDVLDEKAHEKISADGTRCWLLQVSEAHTSDPRIRAMLEAGERDKLDDRYLCRARDPWYAVERIPAPDILIGPMGKERFRVVINELGAIPTNTLYGLRLRNRSLAAEQATIQRLATWLRSGDGQILLRAAARKHHGDGLVKLEPGGLARVRVPAAVVAHLL